MFCIVLGGKESVKWCNMHGDVAVAQMSEREHLLAASRASASEYVPSPTEWSVGNVFFPSVVRASEPGKCVACRTFQSCRIRVDDNRYLVEREC